VKEQCNLSDYLLAGRSMGAAGLRKRPGIGFGVGSSRKSADPIDDELLRKRSFRWSRQARLRAEMLWMGDSGSAASRAGYRKDSGAGMGNSDLTHLSGFDAQCGELMQLSRW